MGILRETLLGAMLCGALATIVVADEQEQADADLLEFLGMWEDDDDQWELFVDFAGDSVDSDVDSGTDSEVDIERSAQRDAIPDYE